MAAADLLASVCSSSTATAGLFDVKVLQYNQNLLLQCAGQSLCISWVPSTGRAGCTRRRAWVWVLRWCFVGAFIWSVIVQEHRTCLRSVRDCVVCARVVMWAAVLRSCALVAWVAFGSAALVGMRDAGARGGRAGAGGRMAQRRALRHLGHFGPVS